jgi:hypothetical protein
MARIHCTPGSLETNTEHYTYRIVNPTVIVQRARNSWLIGITHVDGSWQVAALCPNRDAARKIGRTLVERYATALLDNVSDYVQVAHDVVEQYVHLTMDIAEHPGTTDEEDERQ